MLSIAYDREASTEMDAKYFVYDEDKFVLYKGTYAQCLVIVGAFHLYPEITLEEIKDKTNGFI